MNNLTSKILASAAYRRLVPYDVCIMLSQCMTQHTFFLITWDTIKINYGLQQDHFAFFK